MTPEQAIRVLHAAADAVRRAGYVLTGELCFCRPATPGLVSVVATGHVGGAVARLEVRAVPRDAVVTPRVPTPPELPAAAGESVATGAAAAGVHPAVRQAERLAGHPFAPVANTGEVCFRCGSADLRWAGACKVCNSCGESGGCG